MNWFQNVNSWCQLIINHRSKMKVLWRQLLTSNWGQQLVSHWCHTLTSKFLKINQNVFSTKMFFQPKCFFNQNYFSPNLVANGHFLKIFLASYWPHMLMSIRYLQFNISTMSKSGLLMLFQDTEKMLMSIEVRVQLSKCSNLIRHFPQGACGYFSITTQCGL